MARSDGAVVIETRLNTEKIDTDFKKIDKQTKNMINRYNKSVDSIKSQEIALEKVKKQLDSIVSSEKTPASVKAMETELNKINRQFNDADKRLTRNKDVIEEKKGQKQIQKGLGNQEEVSRIENEIQSVLKENEELKNTMISLDEKAAELEAKISEIKLDPNNSLEAQNLTQKIENMTSKLEESKKQTNELGKSIKKNLGIKAQLSGITEGFDGIGKKVDKLKTRMTRLIGTVAVFSLIRSGLTSLRNSFTSLLKQNDTFKSSLNQIKANLMTAFAPIYNACLPAINSLMNSLSKLTGTIAVFVSGLFGTSLEDAKKQAEGLSKSLDSTAKSGEKASGSLASFDNLEVINDNSSSGPSSSSSSGINYSGELQYSEKLLNNLNDIKEKIESIILFVTENKDIVIATIAGIVAGIAAVKAIKLVELLKDGEKLKELISNFKTVAKGIGIGLIVAGVITLVTNLSNLITKWDDMTTKEKIISASLAVLGAAFIALGYAIATGLSAATLGIGALIALVAAAITAIVSFIVKLANEEKAILSVADANERLLESQEALKEANQSYIDAIDNSEEALNKLREAEESTGLSGEELYKSVQNGTLDYANMTSAQREVYKAYLNNQEAQENLKTATDDLTEAKKAENAASWDNQLAIAAESGSYDEFKKSVVEAYEKGELSAEEARDLIGKAMTGISRDSRTTFAEDIPSDITNGLDVKNYQTTGQKLSDWFGKTFDGIKEAAKKAWNSIVGFFSEGGGFDKIKESVGNIFKELLNKLIDGLNSIIRKPFDKINGLLNTIKDVEFMGLKPFSKLWGYNPLPVPQIPKLATGAVIPPRSEFMAILGDQKRGVNIETPLDTMVEAFNKALDKRGNASGELVLNNATFIIRAGNDDLSKAVVKSVRIAEKDLGKPLFVN